MQDPAPTLDELEAWARDHDGEGWHKLISALTDLYLANADVDSAGYGDAYGEVMNRLLDDVAAEVRAELAERVAPLENYPGDVIKRLADDEPEVAGPVLEKSPLLSEKDLIEIIHRKLPEYARSISKRKGIGEKITDAIVSKGDKESIRSVAANPEASFSDRTYRLVAEKAKADPHLQESIMTRADLTQAVAVQLTPFLSEELKARLKEIDKKESGSLLKGLDDFTSEMAKKSETRKDKIEAYAAVAQVRGHEVSVDDVVKKMSGAGKLGALTHFLGGLHELTDEKVSELFYAPDGTLFAQLCKSLGMKDDAFNALLSFKAKLTGMSADAAGKDLDVFKRLDVKASREAVAKLHGK